jgi:hypothetical protein
LVPKSSSDVTQESCGSSTTSAADADADAVAYAADADADADATDATADTTAAEATRGLNSCRQYGHFCPWLWLARLIRSIKQDKQISCRQHDTVTSVDDSTSASSQIGQDIEVISLFVFDL